MIKKKKKKSLYVTSMLGFPFLSHLVLFQFRDRDRMAALFIQIKQVQKKEKPTSNSHATNQRRCDDKIEKGLYLNK